MKRLAEPPGGRPTQSLNELADWCCFQCRSDCRIMLALALSARNEPWAGMLDSMESRIPGRAHAANHAGTYFCVVVRGEVA